MTELLRKAMDMASKLPLHEQETLAAMWIEEMESEAKWNQLFTQSHDVLEQLANEALEDFKAGKTESMGWDKL